MVWVESFDYLHSNSLHYRAAESVPGYGCMVPDLNVVSGEICAATIIYRCSTGQVTTFNIIGLMKILWDS